MENLLYTSFESEKSNTPHVLEPKLEIGPFRTTAFEKLCRFVS
jgi:hypothetical protein